VKGKHIKTRAPLVAGSERREHHKNEEERGCNLREGLGGSFAFGQNESNDREESSFGLYSG
jgi:hypothetical protein